MSDVKNVGIADMKIAKSPDSLITYALGSCVGIILYDKTLLIAAMIHIMLPDAMSEPPDNIYKYANTAIAETLRKLEIMGVARSRLTAKIAGGSKMFNVAPGGIIGTIGDRNVERVIEILQKNRIPIIGKDTGGSTARTLAFDPQTGAAVIRLAGQGYKNL